MKTKKPSKRGFINILHRFKVIWFKVMIALTSDPFKVAQYWRTLGLKIGKNSCIYHNVIISGDGSEPITIGSSCVLTGCTILAHDASTNHAMGIKYGEPSPTAPVVIEDNCFIGYGAIVLMGVNVGHDSIVGAGAVVTKDVPPRSVVAGNPAKVICTIDELVEKRKCSSLTSISKFDSDKIR